MEPLGRYHQIDLQSGLSVAVRAVQVARALLAVGWRDQAEAVPPAVAEFQAAATRFIAQAERLAAQCGVELERRDLRPLVVGQLVRARDSLEETCQEIVMGHGRLPPSTAAFLQRALADLLVDLWSLERIARRLPPLSG